MPRRSQRLAEAGLGAEDHKLWTATAISTLGDGVYLAGLPPLGALLGGVLGRTLGLRAPFVFGAVILAAMALLALPAVNTRSVEAARVQAPTASACDQEHVSYL